jgi:hypothetical protein
MAELNDSPNPNPKPTPRPTVPEGMARRQMLLKAAGLAAAPVVLTVRATPAWAQGKGKGQSTGGSHTGSGRP